MERRLPEGWDSLPLRDVCILNPPFRGEGPGEVSFVPMSAVGERTGYVDLSEIRCLKDVRKGYSAFRNGDVLYAKITPCMENGKIAVVDGLHNGIGFGSTEFHVLRPCNAIMPKFLYYFLAQEKIRLHAMTRMTGSAGQRRVPSSFLQELEVPIPPIEAQRKIVAILDKAEETMRLRAKSNELTQKLLQSVFLEMFSEANSNYAEWPLVRIEDLAAHHKGSMRTGPFGSALRHTEFVDSGVAVLGIDNVVDNKFQWVQRRFVCPDKFGSLECYRVYPKDVLITIIGTIGRSCVVPEDIPLSISTKHLVVITCNREICDPNFISSAVIYHPEIRRQLVVNSKGAIMDGLNLGIIRSLRLHLPPLSLQVRWSQIVSRAEAHQSASNASLSKLNELLSSLSKKAFSGEITE